jgi:hypothetical protein
MRRLDSGTRRDRECASGRRLHFAATITNMDRMDQSFALMCMVLLLVGCGGGANRQAYQVRVQNDLARPVTVWLTKSGPPHETGWKSPERLAVEAIDRDPIGGVVVPPGKVAETGTVRGAFPEGVDAVLRIYVGYHEFTDLLAMSRGHPDRFDLVLQPGENSLIVRQRRGQTVIERGTVDDPQPQPRRQTWN